jgi:hypothetical protein
MYDLTVPPMTHLLGALSKLLDIAEAHCAERKIDPQAILGFRLFPDMFPFTRQVQLSSDFAKGTVARLAGVTAPAMPDSETSFAELRGRLARTVAFLGSVPRDALEGAAGREIAFRASGQDRSASGMAYFTMVGQPQFHFHLTTAYAILRHNGVAIGKRDFLGR